MKREKMAEFWERIKIECWKYWKDEEAEESAFDNFCKQFSQYEEAAFSKAIDYVVRHLVMNSYSWPTTAQILNTLNRTQEFRGTYKREQGEDTRGSEGFKNFVKTLADCDDEPALQKGYREVKTMSGVMHSLFADYRNAALRYERNHRLRKKRKHGKISEMEPGNHCYYCGAKTYRPRDKSVTDRVEIIEEYHCPKCKVDGKELVYK